ncbi:hypothetical protein [Ensifer adhaerens]|uniref:hypothetical protein n=1 Tax=Ensifer adhaerens TaxID=106592 RepID=UPI00098F29D6|nr:hypothetical protein [Ensifer adhaerens]
MGDARQWINMFKKTRSREESADALLFVLNCAASRQPRTLAATPIPRYNRTMIKTARIAVTYYATSP